MGHELVIFASTDRADPLINVIVHCVRNLGIDRVQLCKVSDGPGGAVEQNSATRLAADVERQFEALADGRYWPKSSSDPVVIDISDADKTMYRDTWVKVLRRNLNPTNVSAAEIPSVILSMRSRNVPPVIDVTTVKNRLLVDIALLAAAHKVDDLCSFEFLDTVKPQYDHRALLHSVSSGSVRYRNLLAEETARSSLQIIRRWTVSGKLLASSLVVLFLIVATLQFFVEEGGWAITGAVAGLILSSVNLGLGLRRDRVVS